MAYYHNNKDGTRSRIASNQTFQDTPTEILVTREEFESFQTDVLNNIPHPTLNIENGLIGDQGLGGATVTKITDTKGRIDFSATSSSSVYIGFYMTVPVTYGKSMIVELNLNDCSIPNALVVNLDAYNGNPSASKNVGSFVINTGFTSLSKDCMVSWDAIKDYIIDDKITFRLTISVHDNVTFIAELSTRSLLGTGSLINKNVLFLGDSITTLAWHWVRDFVVLTECTMVDDVAYAGAVLSDSQNTVITGETPTRDNHNNTLHNQVQMVINRAYEDVDIIIVAIGTNGDGLRSITQSDIDNAYSYSQLSDLDLTKGADAFRYCCETLRHLYPKAEIIWCNPIQGTGRTYAWYQACADNLAILTSYSSVYNITTNRCGIVKLNENPSANGEYLADGTHPNTKGGWKMAKYNAAAISKLFI